jgi:integrase
MLTDAAVRTAKPGTTARKLYDGRGLFVQVVPAGGKWWRFRYSFDGKEKLLSLGTYPDIGVKQARDRRDEARKLLAEGKDPSAERQTDRAVRREAVRQDLAFEKIAREWFDRFKPNWAEGHADTIIRRLERDIFPWLGDRRIDEISAVELLEALRRVEARGALETAHRIAQICGQVFRYAIATGRAKRDPSADLRGALPPVKERHHAALTKPSEVAALLRAIDGYKGSFVTRCALRLAPHVFVRPGELRAAEWREIDLDEGVWKIPAARMKGRREHIVFLSRQAVGILRELHPLTGEGRFVFPSIRTASRPMSEGTVLGALRRLEYEKSEMSGHGFRSLASSLLNELGFSPDAIERQLAHAEPNTIRAAYDRSERLEERRRMMQSWSDYLDKLTRGGEVIEFRAQA